MKTEYPESLKEVKIEISKDFEAQILAVDEYQIGYCAVLQIDCFQDLLEQLDPYQLYDFWMSRFTGGVYWSGILSYYPWEQIAGKHTEEDIWGLLLKYHVSVDAKTWTVTFKFNPKSPINTWLKFHSKDGDVPVNVETLFRTAIRYLFARKSDDIWKFEELEYDGEDELLEDQSWS